VKKEEKPVSVLKKETKKDHKKTEHVVFAE